MKKTLFPLLLLLFIGSTYTLKAQPIYADFEGQSNITSWFADACQMDTSLNNPHQTGINTSAKVLKYHDLGGQYANIRFDVGRNLNLANYSVFSFKVYVPSNGLTGNQPNQISLKLQDGNLAAPWSSQTEIIKPITLNQWQTVTFDFANDPYINLDPNSLPPTQRTDLNRVLFQFNGENNTDQVLAYIDDFYYYDSLVPPPPPPAYTQLVWADEFNGNGMIDTSKWFHQTLLPSNGSWYNGEIQHYTNRTANSYQSQGTLKIVAKRETFTDQGVTKQFTSARLNSKMAFTYGRLEVRAKLPVGVGTWPAIWMLGQNIDEPGAYWKLQGMGTTPWPACGEVDIMEHWGSNQNYVQSAMHTPSSFGGTVNHGGFVLPTASTQFHTYAVEWSPQAMTFSVDSVVHYTYNPATKNAQTWPFTLPQYILLNVAIQNSIASSYTQDELEIDFVRLYQQATVGVNENENHKSKIYPNPVDDYLNFNFPSPEEPKDVKIYNLKGQLLKSVNLVAGIDHYQWNIDDLLAGVYIVTIRSNQQMESLKLVKQ